MSNSEDLKVIDSVLKGDVDAYAYLIEKYQNMVFRYVNTQFNNEDDSMDITQDIFIMALEALKSFRQESKFSTWLYSIMVNYCKNYRKKSRRHFSFSLLTQRDNEEYEIQIPDERADHEKDIVEKDTLRILKEEIYALPDDYKKVLVLRDIQGLSYNEISDVLKLNLSNVKVRIHRGRELLKNRLSERGLV